jgi:glutamine synthetase
MEQNKDYIIKLAHEHKVKFVRLWFTDILGLLKSFAITIDELEDALNEGVRFDGGTLSAFARADEQELIAMPDPSTFQILPWRPKEDSVARVFCDIYTNEMKPFECDSRYILRKNLKKLADKGFTFYTGPEIEFFFFSSLSSPDVIDKGGYFDLTPLDNASDFRRETALFLDQMGIDIISSHHEGAYSQHEIDLRHEDALTTADNIMTFRIVAKEVAQKNGIYASFMPKPLADQNGSGMHIHLSLFDNEEKNVFFDESRPYSLSETGGHFIAGLMKHAPEFFAVTNQWINSYKRFNRGFEAPVRISWSGKDTSALIRVPRCRPEKPHSMRVELRNPDPACNPYLALSVILAAGLKGIEQKYKLPDPESAGDTLIPSDLAHALSIFEKSELMRETLGDQVMSKFIENKMIELDRFHAHVTDFEISQYLPIL